MTALPNDAYLKNEIIENFGTPCPVIDLNVVEKNINHLQALCDKAGVQNRPHIKTHKSPLLAHKQIEAGARGITCQKLGEAEVMVAAGIKNIVIATNLLGAARSGRMAKLLEQTPLIACADNPITLSAYAKAAADAKRTLDVLIECDTGQKRAGVETPTEALKLLGDIEQEKTLNFKGFLFYPPLDGWDATQAFYDTLRHELDTLGIKAEIVSTGGSPNLANLGKLKGATEHRAGTCIFNDRMMINAGIATLEDCAFQVYTSVVSRAGDERGILDAGSKTLTSDTGGLTGYGYIMEHPGASIHKFAEEHGFLDLTQCDNKPGVGDIVRVIPNHVCVAVNMVDQLVAVRDGKIVQTIPVSARGKLV